MAITISQQPTSPNMANNNLVFTVSSNSSSAPQYQYIASLEYSASIGSGFSLQLIKQQPNPSSYGVFDMGQIVSNYLDTDNNWKTPEWTVNTGSAKRFKVKFGEEYASSISGAAIQYNGNNVVGVPAVSGSNYYYFLNGLVDPYDKVNWNWPSSSYFNPQTVNTAVTFTSQSALTNAPTTQSIQVGEYATLSFINGNFDGSTTLAQDIYTVDFKFYDATGSLLGDFDDKNVTQNGGGPRTGNVGWSTASTSQSEATQLVTAGVGYQNIEDNDNTGVPPAGTAYYDVTFHPQLTAGINSINYSGSWGAYRYIVQGPQCGYDGVRFAWKNEFGVWDYYTFTLQTDKTTAIQREQYTQTFVDYSTPTSTVAYNKERRGAKQFYNKLTQRVVVNSNWLTQEEADWLKELFFSTNVFQQIGTEFFPIVIGSVELVEKTNPRTQTTFQYVVEFQPANQPNARL